MIAPAPLVLAQVDSTLNAMGVALRHDCTRKLHFLDNTLAAAVMLTEPL